MTLYHNTISLIKTSLRHCLGIISPKLLTSITYRIKHGKRLNWENPQDIDEKIAWLKLYSDTTIWTQLDDKYKVSEYVKMCGLEKILIPIYGVCNNVDDIDFSKLPSPIVLKTNNSCGTNLLIDDLNQVDIIEVKRKLRKWLKHKFGIESAEPHYLKIKPCIIAEKYLKDNDGSHSLIDYKIWCFNGEPYIVVTYRNSTDQHVPVMPYDLNWNAHPEYSFSTKHYPLSQDTIPKPACLDDIIKYASILSKGFPQVRVDFYIVGGKPYFGEMTFTGSAGMNRFNKQILLEMGAKCIIQK